MKNLVLICLMAACITACKKEAFRETQLSGNDNEQQVVATTSLELVFADSMYELTGVAVSGSGRMFTNYPLWNKPHKYDVVEITSLTQTKPYPDARWNSWQNGDRGLFKWVCAQAVYIDDKDKLW